MLQRVKDSPTSAQLLYETCMCIWQMTYLPAAAEVMGQIGLVKQLVDVARTAQKEKVFRVSLAALRNLLGYEELGLAGDMVEAGLNKVVITRQAQMWGDPDIGEMLTYMDEKLREGIVILSNFEKYKKELGSGMLDWSPMHTSELFWRDNVDKFEDRDFMVLRMLLKLIETSRDVRLSGVGGEEAGAEGAVTVGKGSNAALCMKPGCCDPTCSGYEKFTTGNVVIPRLTLSCIAPCRSRRCRWRATTWASSSCTTPRAATWSRTCAARSWSCASCRTPSRRCSARRCCACRSSCSARTSWTSSRAKPAETVVKG